MTLPFILWMQHFYRKSSIVELPSDTTFVGGINNFGTSDSTEKTSAVQFETNATYRFVPSSIYSRKKQTPVFKR